MFFNDFVQKRQNKNRSVVFGIIGCVSLMKWSNSGFFPDGRKRAAADAVITNIC